LFRVNRKVKTTVSCDVTPNKLGVNVSWRISKAIGLNEQEIELVGWCWVYLNATTTGGQHSCVAATNTHLKA